jgi:hypothetical protein
LSVLERQDLDLGSDVIGIALIAGSFAIGAALEAGPLGTLLIYSVAGSLAGIISLSVVWYAIRHTIDKGDSRPPSVAAGD